MNKIVVFVLLLSFNLAFAEMRTQKLPWLLWDFDIVSKSYCYNHPGDLSFSLGVSNTGTVDANVRVKIYLKNPNGNIETLFDQTDFIKKGDKEMKKYVLTETKKVVDGVVLFQIKAITDFGNIRKGDLGGWVEKEENLSQDEEAWVYEDAKVYNNAKVSDNALVADNVCVYENAKVYGNAKLYHNAIVCGNAEIFGDAVIYGNAEISGNAQVYENAEVYDNAKVYGEAKVCGNAWVRGNAVVCRDEIKMSSQCINIVNLDYDITILPNHIQIECKCKKHGTWMRINPREAFRRWNIEKERYDFLKTLIKLIVKDMKATSRKRQENIQEIIRKEKKK